MTDGNAAQVVENNIPRNGKSGVASKSGKTAASANDAPCSMMEQGFARSVSMKDRLKRLRALLNHEDRVAILITADPDAIASAMALKRLLWRKVKGAAIYNSHPVKRGDNLAMIRLLGVTLNPIKELEAAAFTKFALVDSQPSHNPDFGKMNFDIVIDHHPLTSGLKGAFLDIRPEYGATSTILTEYLKAARIRPSAQLATALFYGIKTDTLNFVRGGMQGDMLAFRYLFPLANKSIIQKIEHSEITKKSLTYYRKAMQNLRLWKHTAYAHLGRISNSDICVQLADFFLKLGESSWSIVSAVEGQKLIVIFRSIGYRRNAGKLAEKLLGKYGSAGGHKTMARAEVPLTALKPLIKDENEIGKFVYKLIRKHS
ncbi:MAG: DHH family phosphoesterase [Deltaproteobacteria bacterium]|nr:DHH family phosphoesterase [Deltaproteobacteria bacterium]